jgi:hypothetical protein
MTSIFGAKMGSSGTIPHNTYHRAQKLGDGAFGSVVTVVRRSGISWTAYPTCHLFLSCILPVCAKYDDDGAVRAAKVFSDDEDDGTMDSGTMRELSMLRLLREANGHPGILRM